MAQPRDLFAEKGITVDQPRDLFAEKGINPATPIQKAESFAQKYLPQQSLPLGMNVMSGLMGSLMPGEQGNIIKQIPQATLGGNYGWPQKAASMVGQSIPALMQDTSIIPQTAFAAAQGAMNAPEGQKLRSAATNALMTIGLGKVLPEIGSLFKSTNPDEVGSAIQAVHDNLSDKASTGFDTVSQGVAQRGISTVPIDDDLILKAGSYLPKTKANYSLFSAASTGDYNALRNLQSDLWTRATKKAASPLSADNNEAEEMFETRDNINKAISDHLVNSGNPDLADLLDQSRNDYRTLKQVFYNKDLPNALKKLVQPGQREIPDNLMGYLKTNSEPLTNYRNYLMSGSFNPEQNAIVNIPDLINASKQKNRLYNVAIKSGLVPSIGTGLGLGAMGYYFWPHHEMNTVPVQNQ